MAVSADASPMMHGIVLLREHEALPTSLSVIISALAVRLSKDVFSHEKCAGLHPMM